MDSKVNKIDEALNFRSFLNHIQHPIAIHSEGNFVFVNKASIKLFKIRRANDIIGKPVIDFVHPDYKKNAIQRMKSIYAGKSLLAIEQKLFDVNGKTIYAVVSGNLVTYDGKPSILVTAKDITEQKTYKEDLSKSESLYSNLVDNMNEGIIRFHLDERIQYVNKRFCQMVGYKSSELIGKVGHKFLVDKDSFKIIKKLIAKRRDGKSSKYELQLLKKNGEQIWVSISGTPLFNDHKEYIGSINMVTDISDEVLSKKALIKSEDNLKKAQEIGHLGSYEWDLLTNDLKWNEQMYEIYGVKPGVKPNLPMVIALTHEDDLEDMQHAVQKGLNGKMQTNYEFRIRTKKGEIKYCMARTKLFTDDKGIPRKIIGTIQDVSDSKLAENQIRELNETLEKKVIERTAQLERANKEIRALLKEMHHRVKNNLQIVISLLNLESNSLNDKHISDAFKKSQDRIQTMAFIHESLYLNESMSEISVRKYLQPLVKHRIRANANAGNQISMDSVFPDISFKIETMLPLGLLLNELVTNSLKHAFPDNRKGNIKIELEKNRNKYLLKYKDNGIGFKIQQNGNFSKSVGLILIDSFIQQLDGKLKKVSKSGTNYEISFKTEYL